MIDVLNRQNKYPVDKKHFKGLLNRLIKHYDLKNPEIVLAFVSDMEIKKLNQKFLSKNRATDVLSFPHDETSADGKFYMGDIIISTERAFEQSSEKPHSLKKELEILTIHGFLHLMGFQHLKGMEEEEDEIRNMILENGHE
ncbi:MAG: rRNA maturation RNase YbeY [Candidatus Aminicenantes bacterium]|nr:rRNA maturation RNase YbeY [Candidatus Aminicenantes bacterium]